MSSQQLPQHRAVVPGTSRWVSHSNRRRSEDGLLLLIHVKCQMSRIYIYILIYMTLYLGFFLLTVPLCGGTVNCLGEHHYVIDQQLHFLSSVLCHLVQPWLPDSQPGIETSSFESPSALHPCLLAPENGNGLTLPFFCCFSLCKHNYLSKCCTLNDSSQSRGRSSHPVREVLIVKNLWKLCMCWEFIGTVCWECVGRQHILRVCPAYCVTHT